MSSKGQISSSIRGVQYLDVLIVVFVSALLVSNIGSTKIVEVGPFVFDGGTILFPIVYILADIITEVYGFKKARRAIWLGFGVMIMATAVLGVVNVLPAAESSTTHEAFSQIVGFIPRIVVASLSAYLVGQYLNTRIISRLKVKMQGKSYCLRSLVSSSFGQGVDTLVFATIAFWGAMSGEDFLALIGTVYLIKVGFEVVILPFSSRLVAWLKKREKLDVYDSRTDYSLFAKG